LAPSRGYPKVFEFLRTLRASAVNRFQVPRLFLRLAGAAKAGLGAECQVQGQSVSQLQRFLEFLEGGPGLAERALLLSRQAGIGEIPALVEPLSLMDASIPPIYISYLKHFQLNKILNEIKQIAAKKSLIIRFSLPKLTPNQKLTQRR
jgi:hypothetical protein